MQGFRDAVDVCELADLGYEGRSWTFEKKVAGGVFCRVRLDRALATVPWSARFPMATVTHLTGVTSDHGPILLRWRETTSQRRSMGDKLFRYEMMWEKHEDFQPFLKDAWTSEGKAETMSQLKEKLHRMSGSLCTWGRTTFGSIQGEIRQLQLRLSDLREGLARQGPSEEEGAIVQRLIELYDREEVMWRQRSRIQWLAEGDKNTRFFHLRACQRKKRNKITRLVRHDGMATEDAEEMASMTRDFYEQLYTSEGVANMGEVIDVIPQKVTAEMND
jgi:hypothetical protein